MTKRKNTKKNSSKNAASNSIASNNERTVMIDASLIGREGVVSITPEQATDLFAFTLTDNVISNKQDILHRCNAPLYIFKDENKGFGVKASRDIKRGEVVIAYTGIAQDYLDLKQSSDDGTYTAGDSTGRNINARDYGNESRFINHSPNNFASMLKVAREFGIQNQIDRRMIDEINYANLHRESLDEISFVAKRDINEGEELLCDYGVKYWKALKLAPSIYNKEQQDVSGKIYNFHSYVILFQRMEFKGSLSVGREFIVNGLKGFIDGVSQYMYAYAENSSEKNFYIVVPSKEFFSKFDKLKSRYSIEDSCVFTKKELDEEYARIFSFSSDYKARMVDMHDIDSMKNIIINLQQNLDIIERLGSLFVCSEPKRMQQAFLMTLDFMVDLISLYNKVGNLDSAFELISKFNKFLKGESIDESQVDPYVLSLHRKIIKERKDKQEDKEIATRDDAVLRDAALKEIYELMSKPDESRVEHSNIARSAGAQNRSNNVMKIA